MHTRLGPFISLLVFFMLSACSAPSDATRPDGSSRAGARPGVGVGARVGDEIVVAGRLFHTGTPVVLWFDEGGYDGRPHAGTRQMEGDPEFLADLRQHVDQFVIHYDAAGSSRQCFKVLHEVRELSSHFLLDLDGTVYQTLDLSARAWHATIANDRSVGIEIANIGAYPIGAYPIGANPLVPASRVLVTTPMVERSPLADFYARDKLGYFLTLPAWMRARDATPTPTPTPTSIPSPRFRTPGFLATHPRPSRPEPITGVVQGQLLTQFDLTDAQYESLIKLTAALADVFPKMVLDAPRGASGRVRTGVLSPPEFASYRGLLGHNHVQANKVDPGPAFDWERVIEGARALAR